MHPASAVLNDLYARRLLIVTGKGGVGKSTVAAGLAIVASERLRKRTLLVELDMQPSASPLDRHRGISRFFGQPPATYEPRPVSERLFLMNITGREAVRDYLNIIVPIRRITDRIAAHPLYRYFVDAAPGIKELLTFGKIWKLQDERKQGRDTYDLIIVDGYPTGQTISLFRAPLEVTRAIKVGPIASRARQLVDLMRDPVRTSILLVTLPEEMPVAETIELHRELTEDLGMHSRGVLVNGVFPARYRGAAPKPPSRTRLAASLDALGLNPRHVDSLLAAVQEEIRWRRLHEHHIRRLVNEVPGPFFHLPYFFDAGGAEAQARRMADCLDPARERA